MYKQFKSTILVTTLNLLARLPFASLPAVGWCFGWANYLLSKKISQNMQSNLHGSALFTSKAGYKEILHANIQSCGIGLLETLHIWRKPYAQIVQLVQGCTGWHEVEKALGQKKGLIFLTPHLGCFEITSLYYGQFHPITVLFRPPRQSWLLPLITAGRQRGKVTLAPANSQGVKQLLQALKRNEAIGILPDQAPLTGEGEWAPFFGRSAYTMTLASKLAQKTGAQVLMAFGERLSGGRGYIVHIKSLPSGAIATPALLNKAIEMQISQCPSQYLWTYDRYKIRS